MTGRRTMDTPRLRDTLPGAILDGLMIGLVASIVTAFVADRPHPAHQGRPGRHARPHRHRHRDAQPHGVRHGVRETHQHQEARMSRECFECGNYSNQTVSQDSRYGRIDVCPDCTQPRPACEVCPDDAIYRDLGLYWCAKHAPWGQS